MNKNPPDAPKVKKSRQPIIMNFADLISPKERSIPRVTEHKIKVVPVDDNLNINPATNQVVAKRGKERLTPAPKKFTKLKKVILEEREKRYIEETQNQPIEAHIQTQILDAENQERQNDKISRNEEKVVDNQDENSASDQEDDDNNEEEGGEGKPNGEEENEENSAKKYEKLQQIPKLPNKEVPYRTYCKQEITPELNEKVQQLLGDLRKFYLRAKQTNPMKAKRRYVAGLRESLRALESNKLKCVILAPNIDEVSAEGGLDDMVHQVIKLCKSSQIPYVFALKKKTLGAALGKKMKMSCVGIINPDGANETFHQIIKLAEKGKQTYREKLLHPPEPEPPKPKKKRHRRRAKPKEEKTEVSPSNALISSLNNAPIRTYASLFKPPQTEQQAV